MGERPGSHDFVYVHTDIPEGMTVLNGGRSGPLTARRRGAPRGPPRGRPRLEGGSPLRSVPGCARHVRRINRPCQEEAAGGARSCPQAKHGAPGEPSSPALAGRFASPDGPRLDGPARRAQARP